MIIMNRDQLKTFMRKFSITRTSCILNHFSTFFYFHILIDKLNAVIEIIQPAFTAQQREESTKDETESSY